MSDKKKEKSVLVDEEPVFVEEPKKLVKKAAPRPAPKLPKKLFTFDQWAARNGVPTHHRGGMRAFVENPNKPRSLEDWDMAFLDY